MRFCLYVQFLKHTSSNNNSNNSGAVIVKIIMLIASLLHEMFCTIIITKRDTEMRAKKNCKNKHDNGREYPN